MKRLLPFVLAACVMWAAQGASEEPKGWITGSVRSATTGEPLRSALISLHRSYSPQGFSRTTTSGPQGDFVFLGVRRNLLAGRYNLTIRKVSKLGSGSSKRSASTIVSRLRRHTKRLRNVSSVSQALLPLPPTPYDACDKRTTQSLSLVRYRTLRGTTRRPLDPASTRLRRTGEQCCFSALAARRHLRTRGRPRVWTLSTSRPCQR